MKVTLSNWNGTRKHLMELLLMLQIMADVIDLTFNDKHYIIRSDEPLDKYVSDMLS